MDKVKTFLSDLFFPSFCLGCKKEGVFLCQDCKSTLDISEYNYCLCNKNPIRLSLTSQGKCYRCKNRKLAGLYFALPYKEKFLTKKLIYQFKYSPYIRNLSKVMSEILVDYFVAAKNNAESIWQNSILVPVPMEKQKQKNRGYNQAEELAKELSKIVQAPVVLNNLVKVKETESQIKLSAEQRRKNLKGAFSLKDPEAISGKKVFLIDDVYTTGSTMEECANVLRTARTKSVWGIVVAREG